MQTDSSTPHGAITIRQAVLADAGALRELRLEALQLHPEAFGSDYERELNQPVGKWEERLSAQDYNVVFVAASAAGLVGMTGVFRSELIKAKHNASIYGVYVRPGWRGQGLGKGLIEAGLGWARQRALKFVRLAVVTSNTPAILTYQKAGFRVYGVEQAVLFHAGRYYDELLMACEL